jgi:uncharacterized protein YjbI with pentapeptide repeats
MSFNGNPEHLRILREAIKRKEKKIWNEYNEKLLENKTFAHLSRANLPQVDLSGFDLTSADLVSSTLYP